MNRLNQLAALATCAALVLTGCVTARYSEGNDIRSEHLAEIEPGVTTRAQILQWFGAPESFSDPGMVQELMDDAGLLTEEALSIPFSDVLVFEVTRGRLKALLLLLFNRVELRVASDRLVVFFDAEDRVLYYGYRDGTDALE